NPFCANQVGPIPIEGSYPRSGHLQVAQPATLPAFVAAAFGGGRLSPSRMVLGGGRLSCLCNSRQSFTRATHPPPPQSDFLHAPARLQRFVGRPASLAQNPCSLHPSPDAPPTRSSALLPDP